MSINSSSLPKNLEQVDQLTQEEIFGADWDRNQQASDPSEEDRTKSTRRRILQASLALISLLGLVASILGLTGICGAPLVTLGDSLSYTLFLAFGSVLTGLGSPLVVSAISRLWQPR